MSKRTAIYVRVSNQTQDQASQLPELKRWVETNPGDAVWYRDTFTGKTMDRPAWNKLMSELVAGRLGAIVVWRLDRLGRTVSGMANLFDDLQKRKVNLISLKDGVDLSTAAGRLMANVLASVAQYETEMRGERVAAGQAAARSKGKRWGGSTAGTRKKVSKEQERVIRQLHSERTPITRIAAAVGLSRPTIYDVIGQKADR